MKFFSQTDFVCNMKNLMKNVLPILIIVLFIYSCKIIPIINDRNSFDVNRVGIMDTSTTIIRGKIIDNYDNSSLPGAFIELNNNRNSYSKNCNENGEFSFEHISSGKYAIKTSFIGHNRFRDSIELKSGEIIEVKIGLGAEY